MEFKEISPQVVTFGFKKQQKQNKNFWDVLKKTTLD